ncbi:hypothetical protein E5S67_04905 [Microcoleus sp. IPMA8]|uniref:Uncharacterized protein n=1 Tax=Microcoleus asticus IPMA8 TaxID=2563858 RepID=A0ABX2D3B7_9CYAN|nr:hypothetical protein [Microcoleus asticus IPMA8]
MAMLSSPKTEMASGIYVNESGRIFVSLFFWISKRVTILLPIFFYHKLAQSLLTMGLGRVVTPPGGTIFINKIDGGSRWAGFIHRQQLSLGRFRLL